MPANKDHFLPAAYLGRFSAAPQSRLRDSLLWVRRRNQPPFRQKAENLGYARGLYNVGSAAPPLFGTVDTFLTGAEKTVHKAIEAARAQASCGLNAGDYSLLVPFAASLFARGRDFPLRYRHRLGDTIEIVDLDAYMNDTNMNLARLLELQRLYYPVMAARWKFLHAADRSIITNDIAMTATFDPLTAEHGYVIALDPTVALLITKTNRKPRVFWTGNEWVVPDVEHHQLGARAVAGLNQSLARASVGGFYGPTREAVQTAISDEALGPPRGHGPEPHYLVTDGRWIRDHELDFYSFISLIARPPANPAFARWERVPTSTGA